ncbi:MAG: imidazolonepropionase [Acholeplasmataceae bacterium]|nr:imidazolonepropionase [Acholeplasmataceae bacterium]
MKDLLVIHDIGELVTASGPDRLRQGKEMEALEILHQAYIVIQNGKIKEIGIDSSYEKYRGEAEFVSAKGKLVTPGLIDSHTHLVHAGSREHEIKQKLAGVSYLDILKQGGGILSTVKSTRDADFSNLYLQAEKSLKRMAEYGITVVEAKSGYGLNKETEIKMLEVTKALQEHHSMQIIPTFLGAHALPEEYLHNRRGYLDLLKEVMKEVKVRNLATYCDVFCEEGVFSLEESRKLLEWAKELGFGIRIHADEMSSLGGAGLAAKLAAASADHLLKASDADLVLLGKAGIPCTVLPLTSFYLNKDFARARFMIDNNCGLTVATDYNPGSSPSENIQLAMQMAFLKTYMKPEEVLTAVTINAAVSLGLEKSKGSLQVGKDADFVIFDCSNLDYLFYHFGINQVQDVYIQGKRIVKDQKYIGGNDEFN